jgi:hypothetical protein
LRPPGARGAAEAGDLGDRAGGQPDDHLLGEAASRGRRSGVVDRSQALVGLPDDGELPVRVTGVAPD